MEKQGRESSLLFPVLSATIGLLAFIGIFFLVARKVAR